MLRKLWLSLIPYYQELMAYTTNTYGKVKSWQSLSLGPRPKVISSVVHFQYCTQRRSFLQVTYTLDEVWGRD